MRVLVFANDAPTPAGTSTMRRRSPLLARRIAMQEQRRAVIRSHARHAPEPQRSRTESRSSCSESRSLAAALGGWLIAGQRLGADGAGAPSHRPALVSPTQLASAGGRSAARSTGPARGRVVLRADRDQRAGLRRATCRSGAAAGDPRANFLTVGTYPGVDAYAEPEEGLDRPAVHSNLLPGGGLLVAPKRCRRASTSRSRAGLPGRGVRPVRRRGRGGWRSTA